MKNDANMCPDREKEIAAMVLRIKVNLYDAADRLSMDPEADIGPILQTAVSQNMSLRTMVREKRRHQRNGCEMFDSAGGDSNALA